MRRGVVLIATTNPYYGRMAYNLAVTVKANSNLPIVVVSDEKALSHLSKDQKSIFTDIIPTTEYGLDLKLNLFDLSPFDETLFVDSDVLISKDVNVLLDEIFSSSDFTCTNEGFFDIDSNIDNTSQKYTWWTDLNDLIKAYKLKGLLYQNRSEFIAFKRTKKVQKMFEKAKEIRQNLKVKCDSFGLSIPDELPLNIAMNKMKMAPHKSNFQPLFWQYLHKSSYPNINEIQKAIVGVSFGGVYEYSSQTYQIHKTILGAAAYKIKAPMTFGLLAKRLVIPERKNL